jgi:hypothetical protein
MDASRFDDLARALVAAGSRRGLVASAVFGGSVFPGAHDVLAGGKKKRKKNKKKKKKKKKDKKPPPPPPPPPPPTGCSPQCFGGERCCPDRVCCPVCDPRGGCCSPGDTCGSECCLPGQTCDRTADPPHCCADAFVCDGKCCPQGQVCAKGMSPPQCCSPLSLCGDKCCGAGETCDFSSQECCSGDSVCGSECCAEGETCIPSVDPDAELCCPQDRVCDWEGNPHKCCPEIQGFPFNECCPTVDANGDPSILCCYGNQKCVSDDFGIFSCCEPGRTPCGGGCCVNPSGHCNQSPPTCCQSDPPDQHFYCCAGGLECNVSRGTCQGKAC